MSAPSPAIDPSRTAVVLIEYQNDFTTDGGTLHAAVAPVMESTGMLPKTVELVAAARAAGATIVHAPISFAPGYGEISDHPYGILAGVVDSKSFVKGTWGSAIVDDLAPQDGDIVIEGKRGLETFASTNLDFILRSKGITTLALGGFLTNCCVESTMRTCTRRATRCTRSPTAWPPPPRPSTRTRSPTTTRCSPARSPAPNSPRPSPARRSCPVRREPLTDAFERLIACRPGARGFPVMAALCSACEYRPVPARVAYGARGNVPAGRTRWKTSRRR